VNRSAILAAGYRHPITRQPAPLHHATRRKFFGVGGGGVRGLSGRGVAITFGIVIVISAIFYFAPSRDRYLWC
jgi:hypothetical protein